MDPYIEARSLWGDFHTDLITSIKRFLNSILPPRYVAVPVNGVTSTPLTLMANS